jgi:hypothetical protein
MKCDACKFEQELLFTVGECQRNEGQLPPTSCPRCGKLMTMDEEEHFLLFIQT